MVPRRRQADIVTDYDAVTVKLLCDKFLDDKEKQREAEIRKIRHACQPVVGPPTASACCWAERHAQR
jgi:hypothetical protein